ncbi:hypothetical protein SAMN02982929_03244 [Saccharopolyspora kobensis]|uniref:Uncharacterized protein n=2 Tax=Saccharopolyspora kobensis TaxID=146035 RepID=A0A1H6C9V7_9PSEU|nr:hypothetical protein SAMN02982929_03244 [Saccharopolyspora kobensis]SFC32878.1 hypothetical protein SAMN05216506_101486 [Saccharopolyspora kobensis]
MKVAVEPVKSAEVEDVTAEVEALVGFAEQRGEFRDSPLTSWLLILSSPLPRPKK